MTTLLASLREFGIPTVAAAVAIYVLLRGEFVFRYPRRGNSEK